MFILRDLLPLSKPIFPTPTWDVLPIGIERSHHTEYPWDSNACEFFGFSSVFTGIADKNISYRGLMLMKAESSATFCIFYGLKSYYYNFPTAKSNHRNVGRISTAPSAIAKAQQ